MEAFVEAFVEDPVEVTSVEASIPSMEVSKKAEKAFMSFHAKCM